MSKIKKKLILINPPKKRLKFNISGVFALPPLGLTYMGAYVRDKGYDVKIIDMPALNMKTNDLKQRVKHSGCLIYGITANVTNFLSVFNIARVIKSTKPESKIVVGGPGVSIGAKTIFKACQEIDFVIKWEGEQTLFELCEALTEGKSLYDVRGISFQSANGVISTKPREFLDLDLLPLPARDLLPNHLYRMHPPFGLYPPITLMETSRGCNYGCKFCTFTRPVYFRSSDNVIKEIKILKNDYGINEIHFVDPNFTFDKERIKQICLGILDRNIKIFWSCKTRVDLVDLELLLLMKKAGCYMIAYGVESGSEEMLKKVGKDIKLETIRNAFKWTRQVRIRTIAYILVGLPGEDNKKFKETMKFLKSLNADFALFGRLLPDPNSFFTKEAIADGNLDIMEDLFKFYSASVSAKGEFYGFDSDFISKRLSLANRMFYLNPIYILKRLVNLHNMQDLLNMFRGIYFLFADKLSKGELIS